MRTALLAVAAIAAIQVACGSADADSSGTIRLGIEGSLSIPSQVKYLKEYEPLPPNLIKSSVYRFASGAILVVNVNKPEGLQCAALLDREVKRFEDAKRDPSLLQLFKFSKAERMLVGKHPAFYTEAGARTADEARAGRPFHLGVSYIVCLNQGTFSLTLGNQEGEIKTADREVLAAIASSLKP
jgi:hypothetical protein